MKKLLLASLIMVLMFCASASKAEMTTTASLDEMLKALGAGASAIACYAENDAERFVFISHADADRLYVFDQGSPGLQFIKLSDIGSWGFTSYYLFYGDCQPIN